MTDRIADQEFETMDIAEILMLIINMKIMKIFFDFFFLPEIFLCRVDNLNFFIFLIFFITFVFALA